MKLLLTGGRGLVGSGLTSLLQNYFSVITPDRNEFDLLNLDQVASFIQTVHPDVIVHAAAYVNAGEAEKERGNIHGLCYQTNVVGTKTIVDSGNQLHIPVVYISTGSVFHGTDENHGPFTEKDIPVKDPDKNNWYGYTKYLGEMTGPSAIVRISHPIVPNNLRVKDDYIQKIIHLYDENKLFPLFPDQLFPLTYLPDIAKVITAIIHDHHSGVFHVASHDIVSPYELTCFILKHLGKPIDGRIKELSIEEFYKQGYSPLRFAKYSALSSAITAKNLDIVFTPWQQCIQEILEG